MKNRSTMTITLPLVCALAFCAWGTISAQEESAAQNTEQTDVPKKTVKTRRKVKYRKPAESWKVSDAKISYMEKVIASYVDFKDDLMNNSVVNQIYNQVEENFPIQPEGTPDVRADKILQAEAAAYGQQQFPKTKEEYQAELEKSTADQFRVFRKGEKVKLHYMRGRSSYIAEGTFHKFNGRVVTIGIKTIPFYDIAEEDKLHVSEAYSERKKTVYIQGKLDSYFRRKADTIQTKFLQLKEQQEKSNTEAGFVKYRGKWVTPQQAIDALVLSAMQKDPRYAGKLKNYKAGNVTREENEIADVNTDNQKMRDRILAKKTFAATFTGTIDAEQGYIDTVFWGFTRAEVKSLLENQGLHFIQGKEYDTVSSSDRLIKEVRLYYDRGLLDKVVQVYNIRQFDEFQNLKKFLLQKYGDDDTAKQRKFSRAGDPVSWSGKYTHGLLLLEQNKKSGAIEELTMTLSQVAQKAPVPKQETKPVEGKTEK